MMVELEPVNLFKAYRAYAMKNNSDLIFAFALKLKSNIIRIASPTS